MNGSDSMRNIRFPILKGTTIYSPLVGKEGEAISPWRADVAVLPNRAIAINNALGSAAAAGASPWADYGISTDKYQFYREGYIKTISAFENASHSAYFKSYNTSKTNYPNLNGWAQDYYLGYEYNTHDGQPYISDGLYCGIMWNMNSFSAMSNFNTNKLNYNMNAVVSFNKDLINPVTTGYSYQWGTSLPAGHNYNTQFGIPATKSIWHIDVVGDLQPFNYNLFVSCKGTNYVSANGNSKIAWLGSRSYELSSNTKVVHMSATSSVNSLSTATPVAYLQGNHGIVRHFNATDNYEYFVVDAILPCSSIFNNKTMSAISSPTISLRVMEHCLNFDISGAEWRNAYAVAYCTDGTTAEKTGTLYLSPTDGGFREFIRNCGIVPNFYVDDLKFGFYAP